ncbi:MAG: hypothetical protein OEX05_11225 [Chloroflexota bacterium]|nr:hypothetical protein [Chloroflexota bacterium]
MNRSTVLLRGMLAAGVILAGASCTASADYIAADAQTYAILAPYTAAGIDAADLPAESKTDLRALLQSWAARIRLAGGGSK